MDWLQALSEIVRALAWPLATLTMLLLLRPSIQALLPLIAKLKYGDLEVSFRPQSERLRVAREQEQVELLQAESGAPALPAAAVKALPPRESTRKQAVVLAREAEDLTFRLLSRELGGDIKRDLVLAGEPSDIALDGARVGQQSFLGIEVKLVNSGVTLQGSLAQFLRTAQSIRDFFRTFKDVRTSLLLVVVTIGLDAEARNSLRTRATDFVGGSPIPIEVRVYDLDDIRGLAGT